MAGITFHVSADRDWLIEQVEKHGAAEVLHNFPGTDQEAIAILRASAARFVPNRECDRFDSTGRCLGHPCDITGGDDGGNAATVNR